MAAILKMFKFLSFYDRFGKISENYPRKSIFDTDEVSDAPIKVKL